MRGRKIHIFYFTTILYIIMSVILGFILNDGLVVFLGWNILLATVVFMLAEFFVILRKNQKNSIFLILILTLYVLFFPNTFYVLTDFIHLENYHFFRDYPNSYEMIIKDWLVLTHITIGALYAAKLGISSIKKLEHNLLDSLKKYKVLILSSLFLLSSLGIFIGRFLRFNSWQIFSIISIFEGLFTHIDFAVMFILIFFLLHWVTYLIFSKE